MKWWNVLSAIKTEFPVVTQLHSRFSVVCTRHTLYNIHIMYTNEGERGCTRKLWSMTSRNGRIIFYCYLYPLLWAMRYWKGIRFSACFVCVFDWLHHIIYGIEEAPLRRVSISSAFQFAATFWLHRVLQRRTMVSRSTSKRKLDKRRKRER